MDWLRVSRGKSFRALRGAAVAGCLLDVIGVPLLAQRVDTVASRRLGPGVTYAAIVDPRGPWSMHLVRVGLRHAGLEIRGARAQGQLRGRQRTSEMARRAEADGDTVLAAVNADFFDLSSGENENNQVLAGEWWKGLKVTASPYDTYDNPHVQLAVDARNRATMGRFILDASARARGTTIPILTVNASPAGRYEGSALYTSRFGAATPHDTTRKAVEAALAGAGRRGDTLLFVRRGPALATTGTAIPADGAVLSAYGARAEQVRALAPGDTVRVLLALLPRLPGGAAPRTVVGGWPRLLDGGRIVADEAATLEGTISRNAEMRHPRTAVGITRSGGELLLLTVDGRSENSGGATLVELAGILRRFGAWEAMNFDGGGSTTMVVRGRVVNVPSDTTGERAVGNALLVVRRGAVRGK